MAFFDVHCFSDTLGLTISFHVLLPQAERTGVIARREFPTLYLLHGLSDDHTMWMRRTSIERYAAAKNLAVVVPAVARSYYQNMASGPKYWTFIGEELPALCRSWFPLSAAREDNFAAGLSMGGYGALRLGLAYAKKFAAVASFSGALDLARLERDLGKTDVRIDRAEWTAIFGERGVAGTDANLFPLVERAAKSREPLPRIFISCGAEDSLLDGSRAFHTHLDRLGVAHTYEESPGTHEWGYWDRQIQRALDWLPLRG
ncbi:MAG TPA: alpha/beta hydrolase family protein [Chthoniobacteraceae bacterium]|nr:alpha/beta hydrolase family protein [Chthoniobacteraceae bacterium]